MATTPVPETIGATRSSSTVHVENENGRAPLEQVSSSTARPACFRSTLQEVLFVLTATMAIAMSSFLLGAVAVISSFVGRSLGMTTAQITWLSSSSSLSSGAFLLFFGRVADMFGRKPLFVGALFLFSVFCLVAGFVHEAISLDVLNGVLGLLSAAAVPPAVGILGAAYEKPSKRKNAAFACFSAGNPIGFVFGLIFGGLASTLFGWRAAYWLLAIVFIIFTVIAMFTVPKDTTERAPFNWASLKKFDVVGTILVIGGIGMFSAALSLGDTASDGWKTPYVLALLVIGVFLIGAFLTWETYFKYPLLPMGLWKDRNFSLVLSILSIGMMAFIPASFFASLYFQVVDQLSSLEVAVRLLPMAIFGILTNIFAGVFLHKISNKLLVLVGVSCYAIAMLLLAVNRLDYGYWPLFFPALSFMVIAADLEYNVANMYVMSSMAPSQQSTAGGIFQTTIRLASTIGLGIATATFNAEKQNPTLAPYWDRQTQPYSAVFWYSFAAILVSLCLVPFLTIGKQGAKQKEPDTVESETVESPQRSEKDIEHEEMEVLHEQPLPTDTQTEKATFG